MLSALRIDRKTTHCPLTGIKSKKFPGFQGSDTKHRTKLNRIRNALVRACHQSHGGRKKRRGKGAGAHGVVGVASGGG